MFIDFVALLLVNMTAGYVLLAAYVLKGLDDPDQSKWGLGFAPAGSLSPVFGSYLLFTWPLPGQYNSAFGEMGYPGGPSCWPPAWPWSRVGTSRPSPVRLSSPARRPSPSASASSTWG